MEKNSKSINLEALRDIGERIKKSQDKGEDLHIRFDVKMRKGRITELVWYVDTAFEYEFDK